MRQYGRQCSNPRRWQAASAGKAATGLYSHCLDVDVGLQEPVENIFRRSTNMHQTGSHIAQGREERRAAATGTLTASLAAWTISH